MMAAAVDVHSGEIHYEYYINSLMVSVNGRKRARSKSICSVETIKINWFRAFISFKGGYLIRCTAYMVIVHLFNARIQSHMTKCGNIELYFMFSCESIRVWRRSVTLFIHSIENLDSARFLCKYFPRKFLHSQNSFLTNSILTWYIYKFERREEKNDFQCIRLCSQTLFRNVSSLFCCYFFYKSCESIKC